MVEEGDKHYMEAGQAVYNAKRPQELFWVPPLQTILQSRDILEGGINANLLEVGEAAAKKVPDIVGDTPIAMYSSDQGRSRTARSLAYPNLESAVHETVAPKDLFLGFWEGEKATG